MAEQRRGYRLSHVSEPDLREIAKLRINFDALAIGESVTQGDDLWEERLVAAYYVLSKRKKVHPDDEIDPD
ncbi:hypothetical protein [Shimia sp.]|uniref:hypothetical protein n=1 Tax=Shimia sp. TaxID=1954381 RepID=UPI00329A0D4B